LSKACPSLYLKQERQGFDRLSLSGMRMDANFTSFNRTLGAPAARVKSVAGGVWCGLLPTKVHLRYMPLGAVDDLALPDPAENDASRRIVADDLLRAVHPPQPRTSRGHRGEIRPPEILLGRSRILLGRKGPPDFHHPSCFVLELPPPSAP
jgi:hypothetical protein